MTYNDQRGNTGTEDIPASGISLNQLAPIAAHSILGNPTSSSGAIEPCGLGAQLAFTGTNLNTVGLSVTITTASLTAMGSQGNMTFTNGVLTAQTPAT